MQAFLGPVSKEGLKKISELFLKEMELGLSKENHGGELEMLIMCSRPS